MSVVSRYALALIACRRAEDAAWRFKRRAWTILAEASPEDRKRLDTIKRIMEIDEKTTSLSEVLHRAEEYDAG